MPSKKFVARDLVRAAIDKPMPALRERGVRINSVSSGLALPDLEGLAQSHSLTTIVLPKCDTTGDLTFVRDVIDHLRPKSLPQVSVIALIESAKALLNLKEICEAAPDLLSGLAFAAEDFNSDMNITKSSSLTEVLFARSSIVATARAYNLPSILDLVTTGFKTAEDKEQLIWEAQNGTSMGFTGKQCIHPSQVDAVNNAFAPSQYETVWAVRVSIAGRKAEEQGKGAWTMDGKMIDRPVEQRAAGIVHRARLCGLDVSAIEERFASQEPE